MAQNTIINVGGINKNTIPWININGVWKQCIPWVNVNGTWKQCYSSGGTQTMTVYIPSSGDSTSQSQSRTVTIAGLQSVISCTVNTGSVSYTISGTDVTINVNGGTSVRSYTPSKTGGATLGTTYPGAPATNLPDTYNYNYNGYSGVIPATAPAYVYSGTDAGTKHCTGTWGSTYHVVDGQRDANDITPPNSIPYSDSDGYSGTLNLTGVLPEYEANYEAYGDAIGNGTSWTGYLGFLYGADITKADTRIWRRDYSGTVYGAIVYYYAYVVTLQYTTT